MKVPVGPRTLYISPKTASAAIEELSPHYSFIQIITKMESNVPLSNTMSKLPAGNSIFFASMTLTKVKFKMHRKDTNHIWEFFFASLFHYFDYGRRNVDIGDFLQSLLIHFFTQSLGRLLIFQYLNFRIPH